MKKLVAFVLTAATLVSLCSCFGENTAETEPEDSTAATSIKETVSNTESSVESELVTEIESESYNSTETVTEVKTETETETKLILEDSNDMETILEKAIIFKFDYSYALINGKRVKMINAPLFSENALYPADFIIENKLATVGNDSYVIEKNGVSYVTGDVFLREGKQVHIFENEGLAIITDIRWDYGNDRDELSASLVKEANNLYSIGTTYSAKMQGNRPILFETDEMLEKAKAMAEQKQEPYYSYWLQIKSLADTALISNPRANTGASATKYRLDACKDLINARYLALAYRYTEDAKYLDGAVRYLMIYAEQMLGTDKYLDYSAPTTDGKADIGLNIAAPLTAACDVYAMLYPYIDESDKAVIENWIKVEAEMCIEGHRFWINNNYYGDQIGNNHLTSHLMGIISAAYVLENDSWLEYALNSKKNKADLCEMITRAILVEGDPVYGADTDSNFARGEIYDRYRSIQQNGFGYAMYHLKFLTHSGIMLYQNGIDIFGYEGKNGENLLLPFHVYADYLIKNDITLHGGHYAGDKSLNRDNAYSTYAIAYYVYKDETIKSVLDAFAEQAVRCNEIEVLGISGVYVFGTDN